MSKIIPNSFQYPNYFCDDLMWLLSGDEQKILLYTVRRIFGFHKEKDNISLTQYCEGVTNRQGERLDYGTGLSRPATIHAIEMLVACRIILEIPEAHSNAGKCYALQLDSNLIDLAPLKDRQEKRHSTGIARTEKARAKAREVVSPTDQQVVSPTDQRWSVPLTRGSQSHLPEVVSPTDSHIELGKQRETKGENQSAPPPQSVASVWQEVFGELIHIHAQETLESTVTDMTAFRRVLEIWKTNGYSLRNLTGMKDRYAEEVARNQNAQANPLALVPPAHLNEFEKVTWLKEQLAQRRAA